MEVGAGATVAKMLKGYGGIKGGLGSASLSLGNVVIGALAVINGAGDILDWRTRRIVAGARGPSGKGFANMIETKEKLSRNGHESLSWTRDSVLQSTNQVVVATNVDFDKAAITKIAMMASTGAARSVNPYHTTGNWDATYAVSSNQLRRVDPSALAGQSITSISFVGSLAPPAIFSVNQ